MPSMALFYEAVMIVVVFSTEFYEEEGLQQGCLDWTCYGWTQSVNDTNFTSRLS